MSAARSCKPHGEGQSISATRGKYLRRAPDGRHMLPFVVREPTARQVKRPLIRLSSSGQPENVQCLGVAGIPAARSDAPRVRGDAANPARQESRPARRRAAKITCAVPPPDNRCRDGSERNWIPRAIAGTGAIQHGSRSTAPRHGITGKGGCMGERNFPHNRLKGAF